MRFLRPFRFAALLFAGAGAWSLPGGAQTTVFLDAGPGLRAVAGVDGAPLAGGNRVSLGTFAADFDVAAQAGDLAALATAWREFGATEIRSIFGQPGRFAAALTSDDLSFAGEPLYLWIFETPGAAPVAPDWGNVTGFGLFTSTAAAWVFPDTGSSTATATTDQIDLARWGTLTEAALQLAAPGAVIPEPATWAAGLGVAALLGAGLRRRRFPS